jgi:hypothetical protein
MANAPHPLRDKRSYAADLRENESRIFLREGLDRLLVICPSCQLVAPDDTISSLRARQINPSLSLCRNGLLCSQ